MRHAHAHVPFNAMIRLHLTPDAVSDAELNGSVVIVIDLLRATTTITAAIAAGAKEVIPCTTIDEARTRANAMPRDSTLLGGERGGLRIQGFDLGNGPHEYNRASVGGKSIVMTTTNGTRAILRASHAAHVMAGCLLNLRALCTAGTTLAWVAETCVWRPLHVICAGIHGKPCIEDTLAAGAVVGRLMRILGSSRVDDQARAALALWTLLPDQESGLVRALRESEGGRDLEAIGLGDQVLLCAAVDSTAAVPVLLPSGTIVDGSHLRTG